MYVGANPSMPGDDTGLICIRCEGFDRSEPATRRTHNKKRRHDNNSGEEHKHDGIREDDPTRPGVQSK